MDIFIKSKYRKNNKDGIAFLKLAVEELCELNHFFIVAVFLSEFTLINSARNVIEWALKQRSHFKWFVGLRMSSDSLFV